MLFSGRVLTMRSLNLGPNGHRMTPDFEMKTRCKLAILSLMGTILTTTSLAATPDADAREFIQSHEAIVRPLEKASALAWWNANISGKDEDFKAKEEAQNTRT